MQVSRRENGQERVPVVWDDRGPSSCYISQSIGFILLLSAIIDGTAGPQWSNDLERPCAIS